MKNIFEFKILPFRIPYPSDGSADNDFKTITIFFEEFTNQSFLGRNNSHFHIISKIQINGDWIDIDTNNSNDGIFRFENPITSLNNLTVSFRSPINIINFDVDRLKCTFTYSNPTIITFSQNHNLISGNTITIKDFNTLDTNVNINVINLINNINGLIVTLISVTELSIPVDTTSIVSPIPDLSITCIFDSKTFQIPIQISYYGEMYEEYMKT